MEIHTSEIGKTNGFRGMEFIILPKLICSIVDNSKEVNSMEVEYCCVFQLANKRRKRYIMESG